MCKMRQRPQKTKKNFRFLRLRGGEIINKATDSFKPYMGIVYLCQVTLVHRLQFSSSHLIGTNAQNDKVKSQWQ